jgi:fluoride exporter
MAKYIIIGLGGFLGAIARYLVSDWAAQKWGAAFPYGTLIINLAGSFVLGLFLAASTERLLVDPRLRLFLATGFLGAFTTFSTFTYESAELMLNGGRSLGLLNLIGSVLLGAFMAFLGIWLGKQL